MQKNLSEFLGKIGATAKEVDGVSLSSFADDISAAADTWITPLCHQSLLKVSGADSSKFLQGQLTCDLAEISPEQSRLGAACTAQGRVYSSFRLVQTQNDSQPAYLLRLRTSIAESTAATLGKYIVFFKSDIAADDSRIGIGLAGDNAIDLIRELFGKAPEAVDQVAQTESSLIIRLPGETPRFECWLAADKATEYWSKLVESAQPVATNHWLLEDIETGMAEIEAPISEKYTPHALNYQDVGAVSFTKGCYTGQEVVARTEYRGKAKRGLHRFTIQGDKPPLRSDDIFVGGREQSVGQVIEWAATASGYEILAAMTNEVAESNPETLRIGDADYSLV